MTLTRIPPIPERSEATPALWNSRFAVVDANFTAIDQQISTVFSVTAYGALGNGVVDDTIAFRATVAAAEAAGGGVVLLPPGTFLHDTIYIPSNVTIQGAGIGRTTCKMIAGALGDALFLNKTYVTFAMGTEHSWTPREDRITLQDFTLDGNKASVATRYGIHFLPCSNIIIRRVRIINTGLQGIKCTACLRVLIDSCEGAGSSLDAIHLAHTTNFKIVNCSVENSGDFGIEVSSGETGADVPPILYGGDGVIAENVVKDATNEGIALRGFVDGVLNPNNYPVQGVQVVGNTVTGCLRGIRIFELTRDSGVVGNTCERNGTGIYVDLTGFPTPNGVSIVGNTVTRNTGNGITLIALYRSLLAGNLVTQNGRHGISGSVFESSVLGNAVYNNNTTTTATTYNLDITATSQDAEIRGNDLADRSARTATADVRMATGQTRVRFVGNNVETATGPCGDLPVTLTDAATVTVDASIGNPTICLLTATAGVGATRALGAPSGPKAGERLVITFIQDGVGGRALTFHASFKQAWSDTGNTASKRSSISFIYDGTNWNQDGAQTPYV